MKSQRKVNIFIPARYQSSRFEGKPLADILGKSMIERVYEQALKVPSVDNVIVLTDDLRIAEVVSDFGGSYMMTSDHHSTGTERIGEVFKDFGNDQIIVNLQGDEPLIDPVLIENIITELVNDETQILTACKRITNPVELFDFNVVKVVKTSDHRALYFSRQVIPAFKELPYKEWIFNTTYFKHIGIYAFSYEIFQKIMTLKVSRLEKAENLEQLRWLEFGMSMKCIETEYESIAVDIPEDIDKVVQILVSKNIDPHLHKL